jgi:hypothetical protein
MEDSERHSTPNQDNSIEDAFDAAGMVLTSLWRIVEARQTGGLPKAASQATVLGHYWDRHEKLLEDSLMKFNQAARKLGQPYIQIGETAGRSAYDVIIRLGRSFRQSWGVEPVTDADWQSEDLSYQRESILRAIERTLSNRGDVDRLVCQLIDEEKMAENAGQKSRGAVTQPGVPELSPVQAAIYQVLTDELWPVRDIANASHCDERHVYRELANLARMGLAENCRGKGYRRLK